MSSNPSRIVKAVAVAACFVAYVVSIWLLAAKDLETLKFALPYVSGILFCALVAIAVIRDTDQWDTVKDADKDTGKPKSTSQG